MRAGTGGVREAATDASDSSYITNIQLVRQIDFKQTTTLRMSRVNNYDYLNRLASTASHPGSGPSLASLTYAYQYNDANQRVRTTLADGSYWLYEYDSLGQVKSGKRYWSDHTPVAGQQFEYGFDDIGNRTTTKAGGDSAGANLRTATYTANSLNQYSQRTVRRIRKRVYDALSGGNLLLERRFLYDGWNVVAELNGSNGQVRTYLWGADLSGSLQGAGGVGGLVLVNSYNDGVHFAAYDGNGNVTALVKATDGTVSASYEYGPFGEVLRATGLMSKLNPFRFSTKYADDETDFLYYGYRYYNPSTGRWLSRDPIEEQGGINLYGFVANNPITAADRNGQTWESNWDFFWDWFLGGGRNERSYDPGSTESEEMRNSPPGNYLRRKFYVNGCQNFKDRNYDTFQAYWDTVVNPFTADWSNTAAQVGGFAGATAAVKGGETVTFCIENLAGTHSFFLHLVPNVPVDSVNIPGVGKITLPMRNIKQTICWTEAIDKAKCCNQ